MSSTSPIGLRSPACRACGYLLKGAGQEQIRRAVHAAGDGEAISGRQACHPRRDTITGRDALTASELRVARLAAEGLTNREIAQALFITGRTAKVHLNRVCHKLKITRPGQLASALTSPLDDRGERPSATATIS